MPFNKNTVETKVYILASFLCSICYGKWVIFLFLVHSFIQQVYIKSSLYFRHFVKFWECQLKNHEELHHCHLLAVWQWTNHLATLGFQVNMCHFDTNSFSFYNNPVILGGLNILRQKTEQISFEVSQSSEWENITELTLSSLKEAHGTIRKV